MYVQNRFLNICPPLVCAVETLCDQSDEHCGSDGHLAVLLGEANDNVGRRDGGVEWDSHHPDGAAGAGVACAQARHPLRQNAGQ